MKTELLVVLRRIAALSNKTVKGMVRDLRTKRKVPVHFTTFRIGRVSYTLFTHCCNHYDVCAGNPVDKQRIKMLLGMPVDERTFIKAAQAT